MVFHFWILIHIFLGPVAPFFFTCYLSQVGWASSSLFFLCLMSEPGPSGPAALLLFAWARFRCVIADGKTRAPPPFLRSIYTIWVKKNQHLSTKLNIFKFIRFWVRLRTLDTLGLIGKWGIKWDSLGELRTFDNLGYFRMCCKAFGKGKDTPVSTLKIKKRTLLSLKRKMAVLSVKGHSCLQGS